MERVGREWGPVLAWARGHATQTAITVQIGHVKSWLSRHETGHATLSADDLIDLHRVLTITPGTRVRGDVLLDDLIALAEELHRGRSAPAPTWIAPARWTQDETHRWLSARLAERQRRRRRESTRPV